MVNKINAITYNYIQLNTISNISNSVMLVGPSCSGKSSVRNVSTAAIQCCDVAIDIKTELYDIHPKDIINKH